MKTELAQRLTQRLNDAAEDLAGDPARIIPQLAQIKDDATAASCWGIVGQTDYLAARGATEQGDYEQASRLLSSAATAHTRAGDLLSATRTVLGRMHVLNNLGKHTEALHLGQNTLQRIQSGEPTSNEWRWLSGALLENTGIALGLSGQHRAAMNSYTEAAIAFDAVGTIADTRRIRANKGVELLEVGRFSEAIGVLAAVAEEFAADGDKWWYGVASGWLARAHLGMGATERAIEVAQRALDTLSEVGATAEILRVRLVVSATLMATGNASLAGRQATAIAVDAAKAHQPGELGSAWFLIGLALAERGRLRAAARAFDRAACTHEHSGQIRSAARARLARAEVALTHDQASADIEWLSEHLDVADAPLEHARANLIAAQWLDGADQQHMLEQCLALCGDNAPLQLIATAETELGRVLVDLSQSHEAEAVLRRASRRDSRRRRLLHLSLQWSRQNTGPITADDILIAALVDEGSQTSISEAFRHSEATKLPVHTANRSVHTATKGPEFAVSYRDLKDRVIGFASRKGEVVLHVELDRQQLADARTQIVLATQQSVEHGANSMSATALETACAVYSRAAGFDELIAALDAPSAEALSVSHHGIVSGEPLMSKDRPELTIVERPSLTTETPGVSARTSTLIVDAGGEDLTWRRKEIEALRIASVASVLATNVGSIDELSSLIDAHDTVHFIGHAAPGDVRRRSAIDFGSWILDEAGILTLPLAHRLVVFNVCYANAPTNPVRYNLGGLSASALATGATAVVGSHWPVADSTSVTVASSLYGALAQGATDLEAFIQMKNRLRTNHPHPLMWAGWSYRSLAQISQQQQGRTDV
ncbi:CHAT domain-containing protein [Acidimicrobiaceae bacterium AH-315-P05]|nr:CHAT domain-containing protein [Acidimicrobiaceae bacterium AH-315-P05]